MKNEVTTPIRRHMPSIIRRYRDAAGLSQQQLAAHVDVSKGFISALEGGRNMPNVEMLIRIANVCGVRPGEMLDALVEAAGKRE